MSEAMDSALEVFNPNLTKLICDLWAELNTTDSGQTVSSLASWISGVIAGVSVGWNLHPCISPVLNDLETLESVLVMRGRGAA